MVRKTIILALLWVSFSVFAEDSTPIIELSPEQEARFIAGLNDPRINFLREVIDECVASELSADSCQIFRFYKVDVNDIKGKFLLYQAQDVVTGGFGIAVIFVDNPRKMFNAVVRSDGSLRMHQFYQVTVPPESMSNILTSYSSIMKNERLLK